MTAFLHQVGVVMPSQITYTQSSNIHPLAHILGTYALLLVVAPYFYKNRM